MEERYIYNMNHESRGMAVIINNTFRNSFYCDRKKSSNDVEAIKISLCLLGFKSEVHENLSATEIENLMTKYGQVDHTSMDCFMCFIMSYGEEGVIFGNGNDLKKIEFKTLMKPFKGHVCKSLAGKPKIFFVQACPPVLKDQADAKRGEPEYKTIPVEADFLTVFSVIPGSNGWDEGNGRSWFIGALSDSIDGYYEQLKDKKLDLLRLMTRVNNKVWQKATENKEELKLPCVTSQLNKLIYFPKIHTNE